MTHHGLHWCPQMLQGKAHLLPLKSFEIMSPWDLGGDGKHFWDFYLDEEWYVKLMRK